MQPRDYYKDGVARVIDLLRDTFGSYFKEYFDGEPENVPESQLPCVMVTSPRIAIATDTTSTDAITEEVTITICLNKKDDVGAKSNDDLTMYRIRKLIMGQSPTNQNTSYPEYLENTVMYAIRKHITLDGASTNNRVTVDFDIDIIGENTLVQKAMVTMQIDREALIPSRD